MTDQKEPTYSEPEDSDGSFIRWQGITLTQVGYSVNLILTFATASLGFSLSLIKDGTYTPGCWAKVFMAVSLLMILFSIIFGIWCVINRLRSFRHTKNAARIRERRDEKQKDSYQQGCFDKLKAELEAERARYKILDKRTWVLFWFQVTSFGLGVLLLIASFVSAYRGKLF